MFPCFPPHSQPLCLTCKHLTLGQLSTASSTSQELTLFHSLARFSSNVGLEEFFVIVEISLTQIEEIKCEAKCLINTLALRVP